MELEIDDLHFVSFPCHCSDTNTNASTGDVISGSTSIQGSSSKNNLVSADSVNAEGFTFGYIILFFISMAIKTPFECRQADSGGDHALQPRHCYCIAQSHS